MTSYYVSPKNFISFAGPAAENPDGLEPGAPAWHDRLGEDLYSGHLDIVITTKTPLLLVDQARARWHNGHKILPPRVDCQGRPMLAASSVLGMLRSAYEAVTNSAMGVFDERFDHPLALRQTTSVARRARLARVTGDRVDVQPRLMPAGLLQIARDDFEEKRTRKGKLLPDPWIAETGAEDADGTAAEHGRESGFCLALYYRCPKRPPNRPHAKVQDPFYYWRVVRPGSRVASHCTNAHCTAGHHKRIAGATVRVKGIPYLTGKTFGTKHDGRLYITDLIEPGQGEDGAVLAELARPHEASLDSANSAHDREQVQALIAGWRGVLASYQDAEEDSSSSRPDNATTPPYVVARAVNQQRNDSEEAEAVWQQANSVAEAWRDLRNLHPDAYSRDDATTAGGPDGICFAILSTSLTEVESLSPAMIGREPFTRAPNALVPAGLLPPTAIHQLTSADRLFGWVAQRREAEPTRGRKAFRGQLRIDPVVAGTPGGPDGTWIREFETPLELAVLNSPKPSYYRAYVGNADGEPLPDGGEKSTAHGYTKDQQLRGRSIYVHHAGLPEDYWVPQLANGRAAQQTADGRFRQYTIAAYEVNHHVQPKEAVTVSVDGWVPEGTTFTTRVSFVNIARVELSALVWLLSLNGASADPEPGSEDVYFHRLGMGKPLGFGSVAISIADWKLESGEDAKARYRGDQRSGAPPVEPGILKAEFDCVEALSTQRTQFLAAAKGWAHYPVTYPQVQTNNHGVHPAQPGYEAFVANERDGEPKSLPQLGEKAPKLANLLQRNPRWTPVGDDLAPNEGMGLQLGETYVGTVYHVVEAQGFAFCHADGDGDEQSIFVHVTAMSMAGASLPAKGERVRFVLKEGRRPGQFAARNVEVIKE